MKYLVENKFWQIEQYKEDILLFLLGDRPDHFIKNDFLVFGNKNHFYRKYNLPAFVQMVNGNLIWNCDNINPQQTIQIDFNQKYCVLKPIEYVKVLSEAISWIKIVLSNDDRQMWEKHLPTDHIIKANTKIVFTGWVLEHLQTKTIFNDKSELKDEPFITFQIEGSNVVYYTNLKKYDELLKI